MAPNGELGNPAVLFEAVIEAAEHAGIGVSITLVQDEPRHLYVSPSLERLLGYAPGELPATRVWDLVPEDEKDRLERLYRLRLAGQPGPNRFSVVLLTRDGVRVPLEVSTSRVTIDGRPANVTFYFDATPQQRAAAELGKSEERFRRVVESAPDGVAILRGPTILYLNPTGLRMLGYARAEDAIGRSILEHMEGEAARRTEQRIQEVLETGGPLLGPAEYRTRRVDGSELIAEITSIAIEYQGAPAVLGFARDVTELRALQAKLMLTDRLAAVGTLAAGVAHEINNPLAYMTLSLSQLERELPDLLPEARREELLERVRQARHGADRVAAIVRNLKVFARVEDDKRMAVHLPDVVEVALSMAAAEIRHRARLVRAFDSVPPVCANPGRLQQVLLNPVVNAAHALPEGDPSRDEIVVSLRTGEDGEAVAEVRDTGVGIPADLLEKVFEPFFTTKPAGIGTGLGLSICRSIVVGLGGQITIDSAVDRGTTVTIVLPAMSATRAHPTPSPSAPRSPTRSTPRRRLLVVDDERPLLRALSGMLRASYEVTTANGGDAALAALETGEFDAVLCDLMMPEMNGMELHEAVRRRFGAVADRFVFMTGGAYIQRYADFLEQTDNPCLDKPFGLEDLAQAIARIAGRR